MPTSNQADTAESAAREAHSPQTAASRGWRQSKWLALIELAIVALVFVGDHYHLIYVSKTPYLLLLGWISLRVRKLGWRDVGFTRNKSWLSTLALGVAAGIALEIIELAITQPLLTRLTGKPPDLSDFRILTGNLKYTAVAIALSWTLAAFGEELVWRGYVMNRVADLGNKSRFAWFCSLIVVHVAFGLAHAYQGITGIVQEGFSGLLLGLIYLRTGKNLSVPIVAHGVSDTLDILLIFAGKFPGL
jgi:uncharacterized protein